MKKRHHGEIRRSQLVRTFGPGAMVDLPNHSVVVSGLDSWFPTSEMPAIVEERLSQKVAAVLGPINTGVALASSLVAGYFPARKAAAVEPVEIIRGAS